QVPARLPRLLRLGNLRARKQPVREVMQELDFRRCPEHLREVSLGPVNPPGGPLAQLMRRQTRPSPVVFKIVRIVHKLVSHPGAVAETGEAVNNSRPGSRRYGRGNQREAEQRRGLQVVLFPDAGPFARIDLQVNGLAGYHAAVADTFARQPNELTSVG